MRGMRDFCLHFPGQNSNWTLGGEGGLCVDDGVSGGDGGDGGVMEASVGGSEGG
jgi:hypothetical protein